MTDYLCHDFKTPRTDAARRLPSTFRFIPIFFYVAVVGSAYMMTMDYFAFQKAKRQKLEADERKARIEGERDSLNSEFAELEAESKKAEAVGQFDLGPAAAFSLIYFFIILLLCFILYNWMQRVGTQAKEGGHE